MVQGEEQNIVDFLRREALSGRFESTTTEIANGSKLSYSQVGRYWGVLAQKLKQHIERGTERELGTVLLFASHPGFMSGEVALILVDSAVEV